MKPTFFARWALLLLCIVFFLVPFALRGSRMSLQRMENNVKDWLPDSFSETQELEWFARHFVGEQSFVLLTWEGCAEEDESYRLFVDKLRDELAPAAADAAQNDSSGDNNVSKDAAAEPGPGTDAEQDPVRLEAKERAQEQLAEIARARQLGDELGLYLTGNFHTNWGGRDEKWLKGTGDIWYFVTPNGELFRWHGRSNVLGALGRVIKRHIFRDTTVEGERIATFGRPPSRANKNDFHDNPRNLTARVLKNVTTGPEVLAQLSEPGGPMWPIGTQYSEEQRHKIARRRALDRLKGALYGPEPYEHFAWTADDLPRVVHDSTLHGLPTDWQERVGQFVSNLINERYHGERARLLSASLDEKKQHWKAMFAALQVKPPPLQTCIMVTLSKPGTQDLRRVIGRGLLGKPRGKLVDLAIESGILPPARPPMFPLSTHQPVEGRVLRMGGPPVDNVAIDEEGQITLVRLVGFSVFLGLSLSYLCFRSVKVTLMIFLVGGISAVTSLSIVWWSGSSVDAILMSMPSLVYVLGLSGAVHIVNYYREEARQRGLIGAPERAVRHGLVPCTLAAFTTALGLLSLYQSNIFPIRKFGLFSALGVMATLALLFTYLPSALQLWPPGYEKEKTRDRESSLRHKIHMFWQHVGDWVVDHHWWVSGGAVVLMVVVGLGLTKINTDIQLLKLFDGQAKVIRDYRWLEANVGKLVPMELIVGVAPDLQYPFAAELEGRDDTRTVAERNHDKYEYSFLERIELVSHIQDAVEDVFGENGQDVVGRALSAATFSPPIRDPLDRDRFTINRKLEESRQHFADDNYLSRDDDQTELWRISVRLGALNDVDYGQFVAQLKRVVEPVLGAYAYRDQVLEALEQQRGDGEVRGPTVWNGSRVAILGATDPYVTGTGTEPEDGAAAPSPQEGGDTDSAEHIRAVFARVLGDLLRAKGFQGLKAGRRVPPRYLAWNDPETSPIPDPRAENWGRMLDQFDCVVLLNDHPSYDLEFIRQHAKHVVDARKHQFDPEHDQTAKQLRQPIQVTYTGVVPIVYKAQRTLLHSLIDSIGWAFVMITAVMCVLLRTRRRQLFNLQAGVVSMIPNVFPVVLIFGAMGHMDIAVDIGTMMTASVAMGVAVDDTIHFLTWFRDGIRAGMDRRTAVKSAYGRVALAMTQTTFIGGLGLSVFALSTFTPTQRFGIMMLTLLAAALVGDLVLLPALLAGPLGKAFCPKNPPQQGPTAHVEKTAGTPAAGDEESPTVLPLNVPAAGPVGAPHDARRGNASATSPHVRQDRRHDGIGAP